MNEPKPIKSSFAEQEAKRAEVERQLARSHRELAERFLFHLVATDWDGQGPPSVLVAQAFGMATMFEASIALMDERERAVEAGRKP
ncbi:MAG: hypothetical protein WC986_14470 [Elusimicrobiota bacterium]|jgi:hypothetical protein